MGIDPQGIASATAAREDCTLMSYSPLAEADPAILSGEPIASIAKAHGVTSSQVALRWLWQLDTGAQAHTPYAVAAVKPEFQQENLDVFGFALTAADMAALGNASKPAGCPFWPGSACYKESTCTQ